MISVTALHRGGFQKITTFAMTDGFSVTLTLLAGYSNFYSVVSVLICFCIMVVFILRLNGDHFMTSSATHYNTPKEQPMTRLYNPFSIRISDGKITSLKDGLNVDISVKRSSRTKIFWGVNVQAFQKEIHKPVADIFTGLTEKETFGGNFLHSLDLGINDVTERPCEFFSRCPESVTETSLGPRPRQLYPVVVSSVMEDIGVLQETQAIVAQFTVIHLKDSVCPLDSHIVYQFVKTNTNHLLSLQPIFVSSSEQDFSSPHTSDSPSSISSFTSDSLTSNKTTDKSASASGTTNTTSTTDCVQCGSSTYQRGGTEIGSSDSACSCSYSHSERNSMNGEENLINAVGNSIHAEGHSFNSEGNLIHPIGNSMNGNGNSNSEGNSVYSLQKDHGLSIPFQMNNSFGMELRGNDDQSEVSTNDSNERTDAGVDNIESDEELVEDVGMISDVDNTGENDDNDVRDDCDDIGLDETNTCIICQSAVIYYTLLPCRHACVCVSCVRLVERCPMCRCYINAFFRLYDRDDSRESSISEADLQNDMQVPAATIWEAINQRFNELFGFA